MYKKATEQKTKSQAVGSYEPVILKDPELDIVVGAGATAELAVNIIDAVESLRTERPRR